MPNTDYRVFAKDLGDTTAASQRTLLLLHGFPESSFSYHKVVGGLRKQFDRVVVFDMLGYGFSDKPEHGYSYSLIEQADVALHVWRSLGIEGGHILSHDMGTSVLTELVARQTGDLLPAWFSVGFHSCHVYQRQHGLEICQTSLDAKAIVDPIWRHSPLKQRALRCSAPQCEVRMA